MEDDPLVSAVALSDGRTVAELLSFIQEGRRDGSLRRQTSTAWLSAWNRVMSHAGPPEWRDRLLGDLDVDGPYDKFAKDFATSMQPASIGSVRQRLRTSLKAYNAALAPAPLPNGAESPPGSDAGSREGAVMTEQQPDEPPGLGVVIREEERLRAPEPQPETASDQAPRHPVATDRPRELRSWVFGLQADMDITICLPRDLTESEQQRLVKFVEALPSSS